MRAGHDAQHPKGSGVHSACDLGRSPIRKEGSGQTPKRAADNPPLRRVSFPALSGFLLMAVQSYYRRIVATLQR
jgi:hypothetical protein